MVFNMFTSFSYFLFFFFMFSFLYGGDDDKVSLCSGCPGIHFLDLLGLQLTEIPPSPTQPLSPNDDIKGVCRRVDIPLFFLFFLFLKSDTYYVALPVLELNVD